MIANGTSELCGSPTGTLVKKTISGTDLKLTGGSCCLFHLTYSVLCSKTSYSSTSVLINANLFQNPPSWH